jgi:hypothetical protein
MAAGAIPPPLFFERRRYLSILLAHIAFQTVALSGAPEETP